MQRVHKRRNQVYEDKDFRIQSLTSLVKAAKQKHCDKFERIDTDASDIQSLQLPLHNWTERLTENLQEMHHHLQILLMQKLGPDARNVIAAERARLNHEDRQRLEKTQSRRQGKEKDADYVATHLSEVGQSDKDELELLNEYRERYAEILAELLIARDRLIELEKTMQRTAGAQLGRRLSDDLSEISEDEIGETKKRWTERRRRTSSGRSDEISEASEDDVEKRRSWLRRRRSSAGAQGSSEQRPKTPTSGDRKRQWN